MEEKRTAIPMITHYICDHCGKGNMLPTGVKVISHIAEPRNQHQCQACGSVVGFVGKLYPIITYE